MITGFELYVVSSEGVTADLIIWNRYRNRSPGIVETFLDANPQLSLVHRYTPFIPVGTYVRVPIDYDLIAGTPTATATSNLWTDKHGYTI